MNRKERQRQLKKFYDKQVQDKKDRERYEQQRASHEHLDLLGECRSLDNIEYDKIACNKHELKQVVNDNVLNSETK